jgi:hypothetical protein
VGRPGLDPGTLGLKGTRSSYWEVVLVDPVAELLEHSLSWLIWFIAVVLVCDISCDIRLARRCLAK